MPRKISKMFAQMKSRKIPTQPCPCGGSCMCHKPVKGISDVWRIVIFVVCLIVLGIPFIALAQAQHRRPITTQEYHVLP
jgi:hypothetical protein